MPQIELSQLVSLVLCTYTDDEDGLPIKVKGSNRLTLSAPMKRIVKAAAIPRPGDTIMISGPTWTTWAVVGTCGHDFRDSKHKILVRCREEETRTVAGYNYRVEEMVKAGWSAPKGWQPADESDPRLHDGFITPEEAREREAFLESLGAP
jgi:hypothetical protein